MEAPFFTDTCPKCKQPANLKVPGWYPFVDEFGDGGTVYFAVHCEQCFSYTGGRLYYDPLGAIMSPSLADYADRNNSVTKLFKSNDVNYHFDYRDTPYKYPLVLEMLNAKNAHADTLASLLQQIYTCMNLQCWDAVGILCRKVIDIETSTLWHIKFSQEPPSKKAMPRSLDKRIEEIFLNKHNPIHHMAHVIRLEGNSAAHDSVLFTQDDAQGILAFTEALLKKTGMNHESSRLVGHGREAG